MRTMWQAVDDARRLAYGSMNEQINLLDQDYPVGGDRLVMKLDTQGVTPGMILSSGLNVWYVTEVTPSTKSVYVLPRYDGSFAERMSAGAVVMIQPRVTDWLLFNEVNRQIVALSSRANGLYSTQVEVAQLKFGEWGHFTLASTEVESIIAIRAKEPWGGRGWYTLNDRDWRWQKDRSEVRILNPDIAWVNEIEVVYRRGFRKASSLLDDLNGFCGLAETMEDIPSIGAAANLLLTTEARRSQIKAQGDPRRASEVTPGQNASAAREMRRIFQERIDEEHVRLVNAQPWKVTR